MKRSMQFCTTSEWLDAIVCRKNSLFFATFGYIRVNQQWGFIERRVEEHLYYFVDDGCFEGRIDGEDFRVDPGGFILVPPGTPHTFWNVAGEKRARLYFARLGVYGEKVVHIWDKDWVLLESAWSLLDAARRVYDEERQQDDVANMRLRAALVLLMTEIERLSGRDIQGSGFSVDQVSRIQTIVDNRLADRIQPKEIASELGYNADYFSRLFKETFGVSARQWLVQQRIRQAVYLLTEANLNVSEIAEELGYDDVHLFSRQFKKVTGQSPTRYKRAARVDHVI